MDFIKGVDYPKELLDQRLTVEGNVIGCLYQDLLMLDENRLSASDFITEDGRFYFNVAKKMREQKYVSIKEVDISTVSKDVITENVKEIFESKGGFESIYNICETINIENTEKYIDNLHKENIFLKLYDKGFNLLKPLQMIDGKKAILPLNLLRNFTSEQVLDWYESQLSDIGINHSKITSDGIIQYDEKFIDDIEQGKGEGIHFDYAGQNIDRDNINCFPYLSNQIGGFEDGTFSVLAGYSSAGKTTAWITILMALAYKGRKVLIISNEQKRNVFEQAIMSWILSKRFRYTLNKRKYKQRSGLSDEDKIMIRQAADYYNEEYSKRIRVITITDADMSVVKKEIRKYVLQEDYDVVLYDTFKVDLTFGKEKKLESTWLSLIEDSREFERLAKKYNIIMLASLQLAENTRGKLFLDASVLSMSKQIKEVLENLLLMRNVYSEELDCDNKKYYCRPYRDVKLSDGTWIKEDYKVDPDSVYKMLFIEKARNGQNSIDTGTAYLLKFYGATGVFSEVAKCKPKHGTIQ